MKYNLKTLKKNHITKLGFYSLILSYSTLLEIENLFQLYAHFQCNHVRNRSKNIFMLSFEKYTLKYIKARKTNCFNNTIKN